MAQIYVFMPEEAIDTWRPVDAENVESGIYRIVSADPDPEDEVWEFKSGDLVRCEERTFQSGARGLVAVARVESAV